MTFSVFFFFLLEIFLIKTIISFQNQGKWLEWGIWKIKFKEQTEGKKNQINELENNFIYWYINWFMCVYIWRKRNESCRQLQFPTTGQISRGNRNKWNQNRKRKCAQNLIMLLRGHNHEMLNYVCACENCFDHKELDNILHNSWYASELFLWQSCFVEAGSGDALGFSLLFVSSVIVIVWWMLRQAPHLLSTI